MFASAPAVVFSLLILLASPTWAQQPSIDDLKWIAKDADPVAVLTRASAECVDTTSDPDRSYAIRLGRIAFRSPVLLGGLAARVGLRCDSCHRNGHDNPAFHIPGVSGAAGTADVTGSVFSRVRDDHEFNPVPIPSLVDVAARTRFGTVRPAKDLTSFIRVAVIEEFEGVPPPRSILEALVTYVGSLRSAHCPRSAMTSLSFERSAREVRETLAVVLESLDRRDLSAMRFTLLSYRAALGRLHRRFPESIPEREGLVELSRSLSGVKPDGGDEREIVSLRALLERVHERQEKMIRRLRARAEQSFFNAERLREVLGDVGRGA